MTLKKRIVRDEKPPRALLCHCMKCDDQWTVRMQLTLDANVNEKDVKKKKGDWKRPNLTWTFPVEEFENCKTCGAMSKNKGVIKTRYVRTDDEGRIILRFKGMSPDEGV